MREQNKQIQQVKISKIGVQLSTLCYLNPKKQTNVTRHKNIVHFYTKFNNIILFFHYTIYFIYVKSTHKGLKDLNMFKCKINIFY